MGIGVGVWSTYVERAGARARAHLLLLAVAATAKKENVFIISCDHDFFSSLLHRAAARVDVCALNLGCGKAGVGSSIGWWRRLGGGVGSHVGRKRRRGGWWSLLCGCVSMCLGRA